MKVSIKDNDNKIEVLVNELPHLVLKKSELIGYQSWFVGEEHRTYYIEFYMNTKDILVEYNELSKWEMVLKSLQNTNLFQDSF